MSYEGRGLAAAREKASAAAAKNGGRRMTQPIKPPTSAVDIRFLKTDEKVDRERKQEEGSSICHAMKLESVQLATDEIIVSQEIHVTSEPPATEETEHNKK